MIKNGFKILGLIFFFSYIFNFVWESWHAAFLYEKHNILAQDYVLMMNYVSAMDSLAVLIIYLMTAILWRDWLWLENIRRGQLLTAFVIGVILAWLIEYFNVFVHHEWNYKQEMPLIFHVGVSPLIQLSVTSLMAFIFTRKIMK